MSVLRDGIGDRDIPGATAKQLVDVSTVNSYPILSLLFLIFLIAGVRGENVLVDEKAWVSFVVGFRGGLWTLTD